MKTLSAAQQKRISQIKSTGVIISQDLNSSGYLNVVVEKKDSKVANYIVWCFGPKGGVHKQEGFKDYDKHNGEAFNKVF